MPGAVSRKSRFAIVAVVVAAASLAAPALIGASAGPRAARTRAPSSAVGRATAATTGSSIRFSHGVPTDHQRPGFEPDVAWDRTRVGKNGPHRIYSSMPFGFSTTQSFLWASRDGGKSYQLTPGNIGGKETTCAGGGDTELQLDAKGAVYFSDLQGLTNLSNSVSTDHGATWSTNCASVPNTPVDRMWFAHTGTLAKGNLNLYEEYDAVASSLPSTNNQLVETVSHDGLTFGPLVNTNFGADCAGFGAHDCVNDNEGLPGNQIVDPKSGDIFIAHTAPGASTNGTSPQVIIERGKVAIGPPDTVTWKHIGPINAALCAHPTCVDPDGNGEVSGAENFPVVAEDSAGHFYTVFSSSPVTKDGTTMGPEEIYVSESNDGNTWRPPSKVTRRGTNTFPWIVAGSSGRVDLAWYHTSEASEKGKYGAGALANAEWTVQFAQSLNAAAPNPKYRVITATEHFIKHGEICTNGLGCTTGGDRSMGDFLEITADGSGGAVISYVDDTSNIFNGGEAAGPAEIIRQISGPSIRAGVSAIRANGLRRIRRRATDRAGDAFYPAAGSYTPAGANLDLLGAAVRTDAAKGELVVRMKVKDLKSLAPSPAAGGTFASWVFRWIQVDTRKAGNGHLWYAGLESDGSSNRFFDGDAQCINTTHCKYFTYPGDHTIKGKVDAKTGIIKLFVPLKDVGSPPSGKKLYNALALTTTQAQSLANPGLFNLIDATKPFTFVVGAVHRTRTCPGFATSSLHQVVGTGGSDTLGGTAGRDVICGLGGADSIRGGGGNDILFGGAGDDVVRGGSGSDRLSGGGGSDRLVGGAGADRISGGALDDTLTGGRGNDVLRGRRGPDAIYGGRGGDRLLGGDDRDHLHARDHVKANDRLDGGNARDTCRADVGDVRVRC
jgi:Ca2+-binding RTX toxin-like protein